jgi:cytidine deaminase
MDITEKMERAFTGLHRSDSAPVHSWLNPEYTDQHFWLSMHPSNILTALNHARKARDLAISYRDFTVGAATITLKGAPSSIEFLAGINAKDAEDTPLNMHAEQLALRKSVTYGGDAISVITVVGETQTDAQSGHEMHTLHPCGKCRTKLFDSPLVHNDDTLIFTALPDFRTIEASTVNGLRKFHDDEDPDPSQVTLFEFPEMNLLTPYTPPESGVIILKDTERKNEEERLWTETIMGFIITHQQKRRRELES